MVRDLTCIYAQFTHTHTYTIHNTHFSIPQTKTTHTRALRIHTHGQALKIAQICHAHSLLSTRTHSDTRVIQDTRTHTQHTRSTHVSVTHTQEHTQTPPQARVHGHVSRANLYHTRGLTRRVILTKTNINTHMQSSYTHTHACTHALTLEVNYHHDVCVCGPSPSSVVKFTTLPRAQCACVFLNGCGEGECGRTPVRFGHPCG